jgi:hypothetical protein
VHDDAVEATIRVVNHEGGHVSLAWFQGLIVASVSMGLTVLSRLSRTPTLSETIPWKCQDRLPNRWPSEPSTRMDPLNLTNEPIRPYLPVD